MAFRAKFMKKAAAALLVTAIVVVFAGNAAIAQSPPAPVVVAPPGVTPAPRETAGSAPGLKFQNATFEILLNDYSEKTGLILLPDPKLPKGGSVNLRSRGTLTMPEYLQAIEAILGMNGIGLVRANDKFLKVVPINEARKESMQIRVDQELPSESDSLISQLIPLKYIDITEAEKAIKSFIHAYGQIQLFERTNSILLTDTAANVNRVIEVLAIIDQPVLKLEEPHVVPIRFSKASSIKAKLELIIKDAQGDEAKSTVPRQNASGPPGASRIQSPTIPGVIRAPRAPAPTETQSVAEIIEQAEKGLIRGDVKIVDDDRTNILIIITRPENMPFFEKIIQVLDVETQPDVLVKVIRLEYSKAEELEATLNSLIGKVVAGKDDAKAPVAKGEDARGAALKDYVDQVKAEREASDKSISKVGELSADNIKILSDKRTNALIVMASRGDLAALSEIIAQMDTMLQQVMIEVVIVQVDLDDTVSSGIHWVQRGLIVQERNARGGLTPKGAIAGSAGAGTGDFINSLQDATKLTSIGSWAESSGLSAYFTFFGLDLDAVVRLLKSDTRTKIMSSPRIVATDNTLATIDSSDQIYFLKGNTVDQFGNVTPQVEVKDIGLVLEVTPHINESRNVMMEIKQTISDVSGSQQIGDQGTWPVTKKRSFTAAIAVRNTETIVLGGLVRRSNEQQKTGVPILSSIPILGRLFSYNNKVDRRSEVVVFITPYVLDTPEAIAENSLRHRDALESKSMWQTDWSRSKLAEKTSEDKAADKRKAKEESKAAKAVVERAAEEQMNQLPSPPPITAIVPPHAAKDAAEGKLDAPSDSVSTTKRGNFIDSLDPELVEFINRQEEKWGKKLKDVDSQDQMQLK